ncbi:hypothetical protein EDF68_1214 [Ochrobactrum sp. BH3]|nr:hypothetical protein EDF68_1214 [Ochrobactrum sp. BH3]
MTIVILGVDLGKTSCSVVGVDATGAVVARRTMRRQTLIDYVMKLPTCVVAMEACCGAHHLGRLFAAQGHEPRRVCRRPFGLSYAAMAGASSMA